jgi:hypothetical protein
MRRSDFGLVQCGLARNTRSGVSELSEVATVDRSPVNRAVQFRLVSCQSWAAHRVYQHPLRNTRHPAENAAHYPVTHSMKFAI